MHPELFDADFSRRDFLKQTVLTSAAGWSLLVPRAVQATESAGGLHIAPFNFEHADPVQPDHLQSRPDSAEQARSQSVCDSSNRTGRCVPRSRRLPVARQFSPRS